MRAEKKGDACTTTEASLGMQALGALASRGLLEGLALEPELLPPPAAAAVGVGAVVAAAAAAAVAEEEEERMGEESSPVYCLRDTMEVEH